MYVCMYDMYVYCAEFGRVGQTVRA